MHRYRGETDWQHGRAEPLGILLVNLGTPDAPDARSLRAYLGEFLSDPRVVELPRLLWKPLLHGLILRTRPRKSAAAYRKIWLEAGSPLLVHSRDIRDGLVGELDQRLPGPVTVALGMRYGRPAIGEALEELRRANARRIVVLPLYPQYASATTGSAFDAVTDVLRGWRWVPALRMVTHYHDADSYIAALAASIREYREANGRGEHLIFSFHGIPRHTFLAGDPYFCHCHKTARLVAERLQLADHEWRVTFQSRFGKTEWLRPYTDETMRELGVDGAARVDVVCPGFAADCLETLEEIEMRNREFFREAGGGELHYIPALNDRKDHIAALADVVEDNIRGWPQAAPPGETEPLRDREAIRERARAMGADR